MKALKTVKFGMAFAALALAQNASATLITFGNVASVSNDYASQLSVDVLDLGSGYVQFKFLNSGSIVGGIAGISFQDLGSLLSSQTLVEPAGVNFKSGGGANVASSASFSAILSFELKKDGNAANAINPGEWLGVNFLADYDAVLAAVNSGDIGFGLHVISIGPNGVSQKFVNEIPPPSLVPDGGSTLALFGAVSLGLCAWRRKKD